MAGRVTFRVLFGGEDDARKLTIESGIPRTVEDLALKIKTFFQVTEQFRLQYKDKDMDDQFMNLLSISELEDKGTLKVVYILNETTRSAPLTEDAFCTIPGTPSNASSSSQEPNDSDSYASNDTIILSSPETRSCSWPKPFVVPRFSSCAEIMLQTGNDEFKAHRTFLSPTPKVRSDILEGLAEEIIKYTAYPRDEQLEEVAKALTQSHPCLLEKATQTGYCGWKHYLKIKMMNFRTKLSRAGHPEVAINSLKNKRSGQQTPAANIKKPRKGDVHFCPNIPSGETRDGLEVERVALLTEVKKKKKDEAVIKEKMQRTFSLRRQEILQEPKIPEFLNKWPALFDVSEAAEDLRQSVKPKPDVKRSKASLDTVQSEPRNLTLRGGLTYEHAFRESKILRTSNAVRPRQTSQGRPWQSTPFELRVMILMVLVDALQMSVLSWKGSKFSTTSRVSTMHA
ncbi:hypothetical protein NQZ68_017502 [Dissostichus eleginoides]|nr:hypothetical protein NQZ68_017502 [Dissostichus eleginoides]